MLKKVIACAASIALLFALGHGVQAETVSAVVPPVSEATWAFLDGYPPGRWSTVAYSLGHKSIQKTSIELLHTTLSHGLDDGFASITQFELALLSLIKAEQDPSAYKRKNLIYLLASDDYLYHEGLDGASMALLVYEAAAYYDIYVQPSVKNAEATVIDFIVSSQQKDGGFAVSAGRKADVEVTALALTALSAYRSTPYVQSAIDRGLGWLSAQQQLDGSFLRQNWPDCETTAMALTAIRSCGIAADDPRFVKNDTTLPDAVKSFLAPNGGFRPTREESPSVSATEQAVIALYADFYGCSPYLHPTAYPGYAPPQEIPEDTTVQGSGWKFAVKFSLMFGLVYLLLLLTIRIGKYAERKKLPGSLAAERQKKLREEAQAPLDFHIPMKAKLPDFDTLAEKDTDAPDSQRKPNE